MKNLTIPFLITLLLTSCNYQDSQTEREKTLLTKIEEHKSYGQLDSTVSIYEELIKLNPDFHYYNDLGLTLIDLERSQEAIVWFNKCLEIDSNSLAYAG